jgi:hypothetical protein
LVPGLGRKRRFLFFGSLEEFVGKKRVFLGMGGISKMSKLRETG